MSSIEARVGTAGATAALPKARTASRAKPTFITWTELAVMTTGSVASLRSAPTTAVFGLASVFLYVCRGSCSCCDVIGLRRARLGWKGRVYNWVTEMSITGGLNRPSSPNGRPDRTRLAVGVSADRTRFHIFGVRDSTIRLMAYRMIPAAPAPRPRRDAGISTSA